MSQKSSVQSIQSQPTTLGNPVTNLNVNLNNNNHDDSDDGNDDDNHIISTHRSNPNSPTNGGFDINTFSLIDLLTETSKITSDDFLPSTHTTLDNSTELLTELKRFIGLYEKSGSIQPKVLQYHNRNPTSSITIPGELSHHLKTAIQHTNTLALDHNKVSGEYITRMKIDKVPMCPPVYSDDKRGLLSPPVSPLQSPITSHNNNPNNNISKVDGDSEDYPTYEQLNRFSRTIDTVDTFLGAQYQDQKDEKDEKDEKNDKNDKNEPNPIDILRSFKRHQQIPLPNQISPDTPQNNANDSTLSEFPSNPIIAIDQEPIPDDYDNILRLNVDQTLELLFQQSFLPLISQLQSQWLPLLQYNASNEPTTPMALVASPSHHQKKNKNNPNNNHEDNNNNNIDKPTYNEKTRSKLHTQPITAIIDLHINSFQTLLSFHSSHRENRLKQLHEVIDGWLDTTNRLETYHHKLLTFQQNQHLTLSSTSHSLATLSQSLISCEEIVKYNVKQITTGIMSLTKVLSLQQTTERHLVLFQKNLLDSCPNIYKLYKDSHQLPGSFILKNQQFQNDSALGSPVSGLRGSNKGKNDDIDAQLSRIPSPHRDMDLFTTTNTPDDNDDGDHDDIFKTHEEQKQLESEKIRAYLAQGGPNGPKSGSNSPKNNNGNNISISPYQNQTLFTLPLDLFQNIVSYLTLDDIKEFQMINSAYYRLFTSSFVTVPLLLTSINNCQKTVKFKRFQQERVESLFANGTRCTLSIPKTTAMRDVNKAKDHCQINFNQQYSQLVTSIQQGTFSPQQPQQQQKSVGSFFAGLAAPLWSDSTQNNPNDHTNDVNKHPEVVKLKGQLKNTLQQFDDDFLSLIFEQLRESLLARIHTTEQQRDELRLQLTAIQPLIHFLGNEVDTVRQIHYQLEQQYQEYNTRQLGYEDEKKVLLYTIQLHESNHKIKCNKLNNNVLNTLKANLRGVLQRVQVLEDLNIGQGSSSSSSNSNIVTTSSTSSSGNHDEVNEQKNRFNQEEETMINGLKNEKKSLIKQVKQIRGQYDNLSSQSLQSLGNINQLFNHKLMVEQENYLHRLAQSNHDEEKKSRLVHGHSTFDMQSSPQSGSNDGSHLVLTSAEVPKVQLKLPSFEEFLLLCQGDDDKINDDGDDSEDGKEQQHQGEFAWDIKQFIVIDKEQPFITIHPQPKLPREMNIIKNGNKMNNHNDDDDDDGFEVISL